MHADQKAARIFGGLFLLTFVTSITGVEAPARRASRTPLPTCRLRGTSRKRSLR